MKQRGLANSPARTTLFLRDSDLNGVDCQERSAKRPIGLDYFLLEAVSSPQANVAMGAVAQLGERLICTQEVAGSIPTSSTRSYREGSARSK